MLVKPTKSLLDQTLAASIRDVQTVTADGDPVQALIDGVHIRDARTISDERGSVVEIFDSRWDWHPEPVGSMHFFSVRPGFVKGWALHERHEDRLFVITGEMNLVLFDPRPRSSTLGKLSIIAMSEHDRKLVNVPPFIWHAMHNIGSTDVIGIDMPTTPYNHAQPDKYRLPIDTPLIPYSFGQARGW